MLLGLETFDFELLRTGIERYVHINKHADYMHEDADQYLDTVRLMQELKASKGITVEGNSIYFMNDDDIIGGWIEDFDMTYHVEIDSSHGYGSGVEITCMSNKSSERRIHSISFFPNRIFTGPEVHWTAAGCPNLPLPENREDLWPAVNAQIMSTPLI
jgi:hypothetical protein